MPHLCETIIYISVQCTKAFHTANREIWTPGAFWYILLLLLFSSIAIINVYLCIIGPARTKVFEELKKKMAEVKQEERTLTYKKKKDLCMQATA